ncbi:MAG: hypothetical protein NC187_05870 [Candidatus Amulumruptor caecigallinarius]|nr:hypothetical protein [Candidatus Amulumruptor caecigallinarius]MCM1396997.1 hypothetical protein [Candidatus Amulumruptor caecigallinarius]MCM1454645.1 hypothetical protein [bacterium]
MTHNDDSQVFAAAHEAWLAGSSLRTDRRRFKDFTYGRQWGDMMTLPNGVTLTEGQYAANTGRIPQTNNLIRQLVKSVIGRFRYEEADRRNDDPIASERTLNALDELDARSLEEFLISGCAVQRVVCERRPGASAPRVYVDAVSPGRFFVNRFSDPRGWDIELVGMLHDMSLAEVMMRFGCGDPARRAAISRAYGAAPAGSVTPTGSSGEVSFTEAAAGRCRVIEVWTLEAREVLRCHDRDSGSYFLADAAEAADASAGSHADGSDSPMQRIAAVNRRRASAGRLPLEARAETTLRWRGRWFAPDGSLLMAMDSPYAHGSHPFVVKFFPMTDGEVHSFVEDVIDQQRHINRLITMIDHIMGHSAKGVLLFPAGIKLPEMSWDDVVREWTKVNGVIPYSAHTGDKPSQIVSNGADAGAHRMLELEMKLLEKVSGVSSALRGEVATGHDGAELFKSRLEASAISLLDLFGAFRAFLADRDAKVCATRP